MLPVSRFRSWRNIAITLKTHENGGRKLVANDRTSRCHRNGLVNNVQDDLGARGERSTIYHLEIFLEIQRYAIKFLSLIAVHEHNDYVGWFTVALLPKAAHQFWSAALRQEWNLERELSVLHSDVA